VQFFRLTISPRHHWTFSATVSKVTPTKFSIFPCC
jgi:hypothetical protein